MICRTVRSTMRLGVWERMIIRQALRLLFLVFVVTSCSSVGHDASIEVTLLERPRAQRPNAPLVVKVDSARKSREASSSSWNNTNESAPELIELFMRQAMGSQPGIAVEGRLPVSANSSKMSPSAPLRAASLAQFAIEVRLSSLVPDIEAAKEKQGGAFDAAGRVISASVPYVGAGASSVLGPLGSVIQFFDLFTGIPVTWDSGKQEGVVTIETSVVDIRSGRVLASFPTNASFLIEFKSVGNVDLSSGSARYLGSTPTEALRIACRDAAQKVTEVLRQNSRS
mgnify:CR=1 FL=1